MAVSKDVPRLQTGDVYRILDSPTEFTYASVVSGDPINYIEQPTMKRLAVAASDIEHDIDKVPDIKVIHRNAWLDAISGWYLVCRQCGEAFDSIETARDHAPGDCGSWQGFDLLPESEAM